MQNNKYVAINVPHANIRDEQGNPGMISIVVGHIFAWYYSPNGKALQVTSSAGAVVPIGLTKEAFEALLNQPVTTEPKKPVAAKPRLVKGKK